MIVSLFRISGSIINANNFFIAKILNAFSFADRDIPVDIGQFSVWSNCPLMGWGGLITSNALKSKTATTPIEAEAVVELNDISAIPHDEASESCGANMIALSFKNALTLIDFTKESSFNKIESFDLLPPPPAHPHTPPQDGPGK